MRAELIVEGRTYPLGRHGLRAVTRVAVAGGRVIAAGGGEVDLLGGPGTRRLVIPAGGCAMPGFNDPHAHVVYYGLTSFGARLEGTPSIRALLARVRAAASRLEAGEWLIGRGYSALELAEGRPPTRWELDSAVGGRPAFVDERGGHSRVASTAALLAAGIGSQTPDPAGGSIGRDASGAPDGRLTETAMRLVADHQPAPGLGRRRLGIQRCQRLLLSRGITSVGAAVNRGFAGDLVAFQQLAQERRLRVRVNQFLSWELLPAAIGIGLSTGFGGAMLRAGPIKVFVDGGLSGGGVRLRGGEGPWRTPPAELSSMVAAAAAGGLQIAAHAIGDAAIEAFLDAVEASRRPGLRHRVEHCLICPPDLAARAAALGVMAVMQPAAGTRRELLAEFVGPERALHAAAHRSLLGAGVEIAFSSDLPVIPDPDPWAGVRAAMEPGPQRITLAGAVRAYTRAGARSSFEEGEKGTLEPGMLADLQVLPADPFAGGALDGPLRPSLVALGGVPVYRA